VSARKPRPFLTPEIRRTLIASALEGAGYEPFIAHPVARTVDKMPFNGVRNERALAKAIGEQIASVIAEREAWLSQRGTRRDLSPSTLTETLDRRLISTALGVSRSASVRARMIAATILLNEDCSEEEANRAFEEAARGSCELEHARNLIYNMADYVDRSRRQTRNQAAWDQRQAQRKSHLRVILCDGAIRFPQGAT
jgi:hypothetical protein